MNSTMFGVAICRCEEDLQEPEILDGIVFDGNCKGVIAIAPVGSETPEEKHRPLSAGLRLGGANPIQLRKGRRGN
jgi:hypothetical protein